MLELLEKVLLFIRKILNPICQELPNHYFILQEVTLLNME